MKRRTLLFVLAALNAIAASLLAADEVKYVEENGVTYRETTQTIRRPVSETRLEPREYTVYRDQVTYDIKKVDRTYQVPITEYQWVPGWQRSWNPFTPPTLTYRMMKVTRWETRTEAVQMPVANRKSVPEKLTQQVPITTQRIVEEKYFSRVAVGTKPTTDPFSATATARRDGVGGVTKLDGDPPREGSTWRSADPATRR